MYLWYDWEVVTEDIELHFSLNWILVLALKYFLRLDLICPIVGGIYFSTSACSRLCYVMKCHGVTHTMLQTMIPIGQEQATGAAGCLHYSKLSFSFITYITLELNLPNSLIPIILP